VEGIGLLIDFLTTGAIRHAVNMSPIDRQTLENLRGFASAQEIKGAEAQRDAAKGRLENAQAQLSFSRIVSPIDGTVVRTFGTIPIAPRVLTVAGVNKTYDGSATAAVTLSAADLDKLKSDQIAAQARVDTSSADLRMAELRARYASVTAPDSGTITSRTVSVGQISQAGAEMLRRARIPVVETWELPATPIDAAAAVVVASALSSESDAGIRPRSRA
jgi:multidrug resistance efflux pump